MLPINIGNNSSKYLRNIQRPEKNFKNQPRTMRVAYLILRRNRQNGASSERKVDNCVLSIGLAVGPSLDSESQQNLAVGADYSRRGKGG